MCVKEWSENGERLRVLEGGERREGFGRAVDCRDRKQVTSHECIAEHRKWAIVRLSEMSSKQRHRKPSNEPANLLGGTDPLASLPSLPFVYITVNNVE